MKPFKIIPALTRPASMLLNRLPIIGKFSIISIAFVMPALIGVGVMYNKLNNDVQSIARKQVRLQYVPKMYEIVRLTSDARMIHYQSFNKGNESTVKNEWRKIDNAVNAFTASIPSADLAIGQVGAQLKGTANIVSKATTENLDPYHKLNIQAMTINDVIAGSSDLFVDDAPESYLLGELMGQQVLPFAEAVGQLQVYAAGAENRPFTLSEKENIVKILADVRSTSSNLTRVFEKTQARSMVTPEMEANMRRIKNGDALIAVVQKKLSTDQDAGYDPKAWKTFTDSIYSLGLNLHPLLQQLFENSYDSRSRVLSSVLALYAIAAILSFYLLLAFYTSLASSIHRLVFRLEKFKSGDFTNTLDGAKSNDELGMVLQHADDVAKTLSSLVGKSQGNGLHLFQTSRHIATGTSELSRRNEQQVQALHKVRERMHDLTGTVRQNVENAATANLLASEAATHAKEGGYIMGEVVDSMTRMRQSSERVGEIVQMIQEIASRTDILAINATIEAARAGDAGRGFAVVAGEVRKLSVRSAQAAQEIQELVLTQNEQVLSSSKIIESAQDKLESIVRSTHRVNGIMSAIASASKEQDSGITATNQSVTHMQQISKVNSALVDATTKTARSLQSHADTLRRDMQAFKIDSTKQPAVQTVPTLTVPTNKAVAPFSTSNANSGVFDRRGDTPLQPGAAPNEFEQF